MEYRIKPRKASVMVDYGCPRLAKLTIARPSRTLLTTTSLIGLLGSSTFMRPLYHASHLESVEEEGGSWHGSPLDKSNGVRGVTTASYL